MNDLDSALMKLLSDDKVERLVVSPEAGGFRAEAIVQRKTLIPYDPSGRINLTKTGTSKLEAVVALCKAIYE